MPKMADMRYSFLRGLRSVDRRGIYDYFTSGTIFRIIFIARWTMKVDGLVLQQLLES